MLLTAREPRDLLDQELKVGLDRTEIDVLGIPSRHEGVVIVRHGAAGSCYSWSSLLNPIRRDKISRSDGQAVIDLLGPPRLRVT